MAQYCPECARTFDDDTLRLCPHDGSRVFSLERGKDPVLGLIIDDRFRIDKLIGEGGMGSVYKGVQLSVNREVAIKLLRPELQNREVALERFFREARTISQLTHPNIVRLIDFGQDTQHDLLYLAMELVNGFNLADLLARGRVRLPLALDIAFQVCGALSEPHAAGVIHRDLKPDNILVVPMADGTVQAKVLDFGIARALEQNTQITATGMVCGTPAYMAPEQAQNDTLDSRADLYSLGVILFEMISGWPPFSGTNSLQIMIKHIQEAPPNLREMLPGGTVPPAVEGLVAAMLSKDRVKRPETVRFVRDRIESIQRELQGNRVRAEVGMTLDEAEAAWLLPKLPSPDVRPSGPTEALRHDTDMERYLTRVDDEKPTNVYPHDTRDEVYPTTPLQNHDAIRQDVRVKVATKMGPGEGWTPDAGTPMRVKHTQDGVSPVAATEMEVRTPEAVPRAPTAQRATLDQTQEAQRSHVVPATQNNSLLFLAIGLAVLTLAVAGGVLWAMQHRAVAPVETEPVVVTETIAAPAPVAPVVDLARTNLRVALRDGLSASTQAGETAQQTQKTSKTGRPEKTPTKTEPKADKSPANTTPSVDKADPPPKGDQPDFLKGLRQAY